MIKDWTRLYQFQSCKISDIYSDDCKNTLWQPVKKIPLIKPQLHSSQTNDAINFPIGSRNVLNEIYISTIYLLYIYTLYSTVCFTTLSSVKYKCTFVDSRNSRSTEVKSASVYARKLENLTNNFYRINFFFFLSNLPCTSKASRYFSSVPWIIAQRTDERHEFFTTNRSTIFYHWCLLFFFSVLVSLYVLLYEIYLLYTVRKYSSRVYGFMIQYSNVWLKPTSFNYGLITLGSEIISLVIFLF